MYIPYTVSFLVNRELTKVVLIDKDKPSDPIIHGKLNGLGGKIKIDANETWVETAEISAQREIKEECGIHVPLNSINFLAKDITDVNRYVIFFYGAVIDNIHEAKTMEKETIVVMDIEELLKLPQDRIAPNVKWLLSAYLANACVGEFNNKRFH